MDITRHVGPSFRLFREQAELSQEELGFRAGLDRTYVSGVERGVRNPSLHSMQKIASALGISLDAVFIQARALADIRSAASSRKSKKTLT